MSEASASEIPTLVRGLPENKPRETTDFPNVLSRNILASLTRVGALSLISLVLPAYLAHHLSVSTYAAWILILQLAAYVSYFDFGMQTAISKFVAEHSATNDYLAAGRVASAGLLVMILAGILGLAFTLVLAWQVPRLFSAMPAALYRDARLSLIVVGTSTSFSLVCAVHSAIFLGLQRYWTPMTIAIINRVCFAAVVLVAVALHGNLLMMGIAVAVVNVSSGLLQIAAWRRWASHIHLSMALLEYKVIKTVARFCSLQSVWTLGMLCVTGLDITIVGHYDYSQTPYYSIATLPTSFMLLIMASVLNPLMPASSALSTQRTPVQMGDLLAKVTRYTTATLLLSGLPLIVCGLPLLRIWVGPAYAMHSLVYLRVLVLANIIRNLCAPYATMISATGKQDAAIITAISEAVVNLGSSVYLASRFGAIGVAMGTVLGSMVSVALHFVVTMRFTGGTFAVSRIRLLREGLLGPLVIALPTLVLFLIRGLAAPVTFVSTVVWGLSTLSLALWGVLRRKERKDLLQLGRQQFALAVGRTR